MKVSKLGVNRGGVVFGILNKYKEYKEICMPSGTRGKTQFKI